MPDSMIQSINHDYNHIITSLSSPPQITTTTTTIIVIITIIIIITILFSPRPEREYQHRILSDYVQLKDGHDNWLSEEQSFHSIMIIILQTADKLWLKQLQFVIIIIIQTYYSIHSFTHSFIHLIITHLCIYSISSSSYAYLPYLSIQYLQDLVTRSY